MINFGQIMKESMSNRSIFEFQVSLALPGKPSLELIDEYIKKLREIIQNNQDQITIGDEFATLQNIDVVGRQQFYAPFDRLSLGVKFKYDEKKHGSQDRIWVKIYPNLIAEWNDEQIDTKWFGQSICSFTDSDDPNDLNEEVLVVG